MKVCMTVLVTVTSLIAPCQMVAADDSVGAQFKKLLQEYEDVGIAREVAPKFIALAKTNPDDAIAVDSLIWVVNNLRRGSDLNDAIDLLAKNHLTSPKLGPICERIVARPSLAGEKLLLALSKSSPHHDVQGLACFQLAEFRKKQVDLRESINASTTQRRRIEQFYGKEFVAQFKSLDKTKLTNEIEQLYERIAKSFADVKRSDANLGDVANRELFAIRHLSIGRVAPEIVGEDIDGQPMKLSDFRGKVVMLDFWGNW